MKIEIENELGISLHVDTIRNRVHENRLFGQVARKKPYVNKINQGKRLNFAKEMLESLSSFSECYLVRRVKIQSFWLRWQGDDLEDTM